MELNYLFYITVLLVILSIILFEKTTNKIEILTLVAVLSALSSVGRIIFSSIPSVNPSTFIIICSGLVLSPIPAMTIGIMTALSSSIILGFGTYTFYQAFMWGLIGLISALFKNFFIKKNRLQIPILVVYSLICGLIFGWVLNLSTFSFMDMPFNIPSYITLCIVSFPMDLAHGISTAILFIIVGTRFINILTNINKKYGL